MSSWEVDTDTGDVRVLGHVACDNAGTNPQPDGGGRPGARWRRPGRRAGFIEKFAYDAQLCDDPVGDEMTRSPRTMRPDQSVADGLAIMREWWVRSVPVVDDAGGLVGNFSWYTVMRTMAEILNRPSEPDQTGPGVEHGLEFVDFTGLNISTPVTVYEHDTADVAAHHMRARALGSILVVDQREHLTGIISEFELLVKMACTGADLEKVTVGEMMSPDVVTLSVRSKIADAIQEMADKGLSHAPLLGESSRPVGVASFRDIAAYFETSLETFA